jgi:hypothetical protein
MEHLHVFVLLDAKSGNYFLDERCIRQFSTLVASKEKSEEPEAVYFIRVACGSEAGSVI